MKTVGILSAAALLLASATLSYAQGTSGTAPEDKGKTGWTGGAQDQPSQSGNTKGDTQGKPAETTGTGQKVEANDGALATDQPLMATGADLKGPPQRFPPSRTPE